MKSRAPAQQKGFTLVEIAIVLVIIGLLLGGVLKGQALIEGSKVKALVNDIRGVQTISNVYLDKYRAVPGDDIAVVAHVGNGTVPTGANAGNGSIDTGTWIGLATPVATSETSLFWQHARNAGLAGGNTGGQYNHSSGGLLGITSTSDLLRVTTPATTTRGTQVICAGGVPQAIASQVDSALDDGIGNTGNVFAAPGAAVVVATASLVYTNATMVNAPLTVCTQY